MHNLANILTITRLVLLPFMIVLFFMPWEWAAWTCLVLYIIGALTDFLDGWVARKFNLISEFGIFLDRNKVWMSPFLVKKSQIALILVVKWYLPIISLTPSSHDIFSARLEDSHHFIDVCFLVGHVLT